MQPSEATVRSSSQTLPGMWLRGETLGLGVDGLVRFGSGLELNVHFHALGLDGVFAPGADGTLRFHRLPPATDA